MDTNPPGVSQQTIAPTAPLVIQGHTNPSEDDFQGLFERGAFEPTTNKAPEKAESKDEAAPEPRAETKTEPESDKAAPEKDAKPEEEEAEYKSLDEFLAKHNLDPEAFRSLPVTVKVREQASQVPLSEVLKGYQLDRVNTLKSQELSDARRAFETEQAATRELHKQQLTNARNLGEFAYRQLMGEYQSINWEALKATDPISWAVKSQEFQSRNAAIQQHMQQVSGAQQAVEQEAQQRRLAGLAGQHQKMLEAHPEWREEKSFNEARASMSSYAKGLGFTDEELSQVHDHRMMSVLSDAARFRALQESAPAAAKKVRAAPVMAKPGARQDRDAKTIARQKAQERFLSNPKDLDAQADYFETLDV
jgi:hypothetical protein